MPSTAFPSRAWAAVLLAVGLVLAIGVHAAGLDRLRDGRGYFASSLDVLTLLAGLAACAGGVVAAARAPHRRPGPTSRAVVAGLLVLHLVTSLLVGSIALAFLTWDDSRSGGAPTPILSVGAALFFLGVSVVLVLLGGDLARAMRGARAPTSPASRGVRIALACSVPVGILSMSHGCGFPGCAPACEAMTWGAAGVGALALLAAVGSATLLAAVALLALYAWPHCICYNAINGPWIDLLGSSPACFAFSMLGGLFALAGLAGFRPRLALAVSVLVAGASASFAVGHHVFHFPW